MTGRRVPEWIGATPDSAVPAIVKLRVLARYDSRCYLSGREIRPGDPWQVEHVTALGLGGENREANLAPALKAPHKAKTADDVRRMRKADRVRRKHLGLHPKPKRTLRSRGFPKREDQP